MSEINYPFYPFFKTLKNIEFKLRHIKRNLNCNIIYEISNFFFFENVFENMKIQKQTYQIN